LDKGLITKGFENRRPGFTQC